MSEIIDAILHKNVEKLKSAIDSGADVNKTYIVPNNHGTREEVTPLFFACRNFFEKGAESLIESSAINTIYFKSHEGQNAFMLACGFSRRCVEKLSDIDPMIGYRDKSGVTPIMMAACRDQAAVIEYLSSTGHNINDEDKCRRHALFYAIEECSFNAAEFLLKAGVDVSSVSSDAYTPLMALVGDAGVWFSTDQEGDRMVKLLLKYKADPFFCVNGHDSWHVAIKQKTEKPLLSLLAHAKPVLDYTYVEFAKSHRCHETLPLLMTYIEESSINQGIHVNSEQECEGIISF